MKRTLSKNEAVALLLRDENASWSTYAAEALVDWITEVEDSTGTETEFCPVAIRCDWNEFQTLYSVAENYFNKTQLAELDKLPGDAQRDMILEYLDRKTNWIKLPDNAGYLVQSF